MSNIDRLLDEAEKAQRKGHLLLAEVCRDTADELGLIIEEHNQLVESHKRACIALDKALARLSEVEALRIGLNSKCNQLREVVAVANSVCGKNNCNCPGAKKVRFAIDTAIPRVGV